MKVTLDYASLHEEVLIYTVFYGYDAQLSISTASATGLMKKKEGKPIKFSTDRDMSEAECNKYLGDEMSKQIKKSKIIQKLYIR